jgi:NAD(P)H-hydrate epimerase
MKLVTVAEMQAAEQSSGVPIPQLMENAGLAVAQEAWLLLGELAERRILVLCGPGNNGGDGLVAARHLKEWAADVIVALLMPRPEGDANLQQLLERDVPVITLTEDGAWKRLDDALGGAELVIDALLGTGRAREIAGDLAAVLARLRDARARRLPPRLLAVDLPTGLDADTGVIDPHTVPADHTVTFQWSKIGLHVLPGTQYAGRVEVVDIGIPPLPPSPAHGSGPALSPVERAGGEGPPPTELMTGRWARDLLPERPLDAHKGTFGSALVVAGSTNYIGAAYLACMGAYRAGAGIVTLACARSIYAILAGKLTETTFLPLDDDDGLLSAQVAHDVQRALSEGGYNTLLIGPGMGQGGYPQAFLKALLPMLKPEAVLPPSPAHGRGAGGEGSLRALALDADALNNVSRIENWPALLHVPTIITPHPGELSRLSGLPVPEVQADRLAVARRFAAEWNVTLVLKGANTIIATPEGAARISPFANPALASGGTGDVLAGVITGLVAQGVPPFEAASLGVYIHGLAAEHLRRDLGSAGVVAGDLLPALPRVMKELRGE